MKTDSSLLSAVLDEEADALREETRRQVVALARRRRRGRAMRRGMAAGAVLVCAGWLLLRDWRPAAPPVDPGVAMVNTQPLAPGMMTRPAEAAFTPVRSGFDGIALVASRPLDIAVVETRLAMPPIDYLTDRQLLAVFSGQRAALVDPGTDRARLIFY